jgi:WD40 repeat protein
LDAPGLSRDFYAHPLSISCENMFSLALEDTLYLYDLERRGLKHQVSFEQLNSIEWLPSGKELAMGAKNGVVQIYNAQKDTSTTLGSNRNLSLINVLTAVGSHKLYIGTENGHTALADLRMKQYASIRKTHTDRVCNIQKQTCGYLMATGGNDRMVKVWDVRSEKKPVHQLPHQAAVKALTFLPWNQRRLMTGGGTDDGHMYLFDMTDGKVVDRMDCGSQICSLIASEEHQEILSTHGFHSPRQPDAQSAMKLVVHSCFPKSREYAGCIYPNTILSPRLQELGMEFEGRQLFAEASPDRRYVVIGTKPESEDHDIITIWDLWDTHKKKDTIVSLFDDLIIR